MKVATFNINGVNKRIANLLAWLESSQPDIVCLQEIKCRDNDFPHRALSAAGYEAIWKGQGPHHGVAILARGSEPIETARELPGDKRDTEARYIEAAINGVLVVCLYAPNGNPQPGPKFDYKMAWMKRFAEHVASLKAANVPVMLVGDYNIIPTDFDIYNTRSWKTNALLQPAPRAAFAELVNEGWTDALRTLHPDEPMYTFWQYFRDAWPRDAGMRLDHFLLSPSAAARLTAAGVDRDVRGEPEPSDHAPAWIELSS